MNPILLVFMLSLPWKWQYLPVALEPRVQCYSPAPPGFESHAGWYDGDIHIVECGFDPLTKRHYIHELTHHLARRCHITGWDHFIPLVRAEAITWTDHQQKAVENMIAYGGGPELHAELPTMLDSIPSSLQPWYPWLSL